jgi:hypothetical protein
MADYFPLIARAVAGLDKNTGEIRRALYERARTALVNQLRSVEPALGESEITRERLALEEAIRKVEAEAARRSRPDASPGEDEYGQGLPTEDISASRMPPYRDENRPSLRDEGLKDFRQVVAAAEGLGEAAASTNRSAREIYDAVPGGHPPSAGEGEHFSDDRDEPSFEPSSYDQPILDEPREPSLREPPELRQNTGIRPEEAWPPPSFEDPAQGYARPARSYGGLMKIVALIVIVVALATTGYWKRHYLTSLIASIGSTSTPTSRGAAPAGRPKITDRIGPNGAGPSSNATAPAASVAQKVVLYDEDPGDPQGKRYVGSAIWRTETVSPGPGLAPELAIRADVEIPERHMRMTWSLRRNTDKALPASHTIEILFTLAADFPEGGIANVPGVLMKQNEQARGVPLAGLAVKVTNGYFLIGLSAVDVDMQRNIQLLKERMWFDIPIVYTSGKRAILAVEKGTPGERAFEEAFRAWGQ